MLSPLDDEGRLVRSSFSGEHRLKLRQGIAPHSATFLSVVSFARSFVSKLRNILLSLAGEIINPYFPTPI